MVSERVSLWQLAHGRGLVPLVMVHRRWSLRWTPSARHIGHPRAGLLLHSWHRGWPHRVRSVVAALQPAQECCSSPPAPPAGSRAISCIASGCGPDMLVSLGSLWSLCAACLLSKAPRGRCAAVGQGWPPVTGCATGVSSLPSGPPPVSAPASWGSRVGLREPSSTRLGPGSSVPLLVVGARLSSSETSG